MIGASPQPQQTTPQPLNLIFIIITLTALCTVSSCALFRSAGDGLTDEDRAFYSTCSKKFGISFTGTENKTLLTAIDEWLGVPYKLGGCSKKGIDCSCFVQMIYAGVYGIALKRSSRDMFSDVRQVAAKDLREGDLLFLKQPGRKVSHVGIYIKQGKFAHVSSSKGVEINSLREDYYRSFFHAGGRAFDARPKLTTR